MSYLFYILIFIFGAAVGSFLNVVIDRCQTGESIIRGRSYCPKCRAILRWYDLIPLFSFLILRGRCRYCQRKISWQYPLVEIATGILFLLAFFFLFPEPVEGSGLLAFDFAALRSGNIFLVINFLYLFFILSCLIVIFVSDLKHYIIPDKIIYWAGGVTLIYQVVRAFDFGLTSFGLRSGNKIAPLLFFELAPTPNLVWGLVEGFRGLLPYLLSASGAFIFFFSIVAITKGKGMGLGDVKLTFLMGLVLGWPDILLALFLAFLSGALVGLSLIAVGSKTLKSQIPFGPFLSAGTIFTLLFGSQIIDYIMYYIL